MRVPTLSSLSTIYLDHICTSITSAQANSHRSWTGVAPALANQSKDHRVRQCAMPDVMVSCRINKIESSKRSVRGGVWRDEVHLFGFVRVAVSSWSWGHGVSFGTFYHCQSPSLWKTSRAMQGAKVLPGRVGYKRLLQE